MTRAVRVDRRVWCVLALLCCACNDPAPGQSGTRLATAAVAAPPTTRPRLLISAAEIARIDSLTRTDAAARHYLERLRSLADTILEDPLPRQRGRRGRLLRQGRDFVTRVYTLGLLYHLEPHPALKDRVISELLHVARLGDWNPEECLDLAEMTHAVAIGYDWFFDELTAAQRDTIAEAIATHALAPALAGYTPETGLFRARLNREVVCNAGILIGALAVGERDTLAARVMPLAIAGLREGMRAYAPDGGWPEGPTYGAYATRYAVTAIAAMNDRLGTDHGLSAMPGFAETASFGVQLLGPTGAHFNFGDAPEREWESGEATASLFWLARRFDMPAVAEIALSQDRPHARPSPRALLWFPSFPAATTTSLPLDGFFRGPNVVVLRSAWSDPNAVFVGLKGGDTITAHTHFDRGSFVLDALGSRWAIDLGADDYDLPGYFRGRRGSYYRVSTEGHNTLRVDGRNQRLAAADIVAFSSTATIGTAVVDLGRTYGTPVTRALRGIELDRQSGRVLIQDELVLTRAADIDWSMHTRADVALDGADVTLMQDGRTLYGRIFSPDGAVFTVESPRAEPGARALDGVRALRIHVEGAAGPTRIVVAFTSRREPGAVAIRPLERWPAMPAQD